MRLPKILLLSCWLFSAQLVISGEITRNELESSMADCAQDLITDLYGQLMETSADYVTESPKTSFAQGDNITQLQSISLPISPKDKDPMSRRVRVFLLGALTVSRNVKENASWFDVDLKLPMETNYTMQEFRMGALPMVKYKLITESFDRLGNADPKNDIVAVQKLLMPEGEDQELLVNNKTSVKTQIPSGVKKYVACLQERLHNPEVKVLKKSIFARKNKGLRSSKD